MHFINSTNQPVSFVFFHHLLNQDTVLGHTLLQEAPGLALLPAARVSLARKPFCSFLSKHFLHDGSQVSLKFQLVVLKALKNFVQFLLCQ